MKFKNSRHFASRFGKEISHEDKYHKIEIGYLHLLLRRQYFLLFKKPQETLQKLNSGLLENC